MKLKTSELQGRALNWAVRQAVGPRFSDYVEERDNFSTCWSKGGPVIDHAGIAFRKSKGKWYAMMSEDLGDGERAHWTQFTFRGVPRTRNTSRRCRFDGPTALIAAMRCFVASELGDEVEIPEGLA